MCHASAAATRLLAAASMYFLYSHYSSFKLKSCDKQVKRRPKPHIEATNMIITWIFVIFFIVGNAHLIISSIPRSGSVVKRARSVEEQTGVFTNYDF